MHIFSLFYFAWQWFSKPFLIATLAHMAITVIGTGFVGVVTSSVFANFGNRVFGLDIDPNKIKSLSQGIVPFFEPNLTQLVQSGLKSGRLTFTTDYQTAISQSHVVMVSVGTPSAPDGTADTQYILQAVTSLALHLQPNTIIAIKSTVPPGINRELTRIINSKTKVKYALASLPEFLREGSAVHDTLEPDRIIIGATDNWAIDTLMELHKPFKCPKIIVSPESAQMAKYTANAYLAQRITFINQIADLCDKNGANINQVIEAISYDKRIGGHYWYPGLGYGGSCFPKDVRELAAYSRSVGEGDGLFVKIDELNSQRITKKIASFDQAVNKFAGKTVAVLGLSFKPNTNDIREAPSVYVIPQLERLGAKVRAYDPQAMPLAKQHFTKVYFATDVYDCVNGTDIIMLLVEWDEFLSLELDTLIQSMRPHPWFIDTRNVYTNASVEKTGMKYLGVGS